jgi:hypothetical protein
MDRTLLLNGATPWHFALSGVGLALLTLLLLWLLDTRLGLSTGLESVCSLVSRAPYFRRPELTKSNAQRLSMLSGLTVGGLLAALSTGGLHFSWEMGMFDEGLSSSPAVKGVWVFVGGLFVGFGARLAGGCTSGHAMFGLPNFERASIRATLAFMVSGIATTFFVHSVLFG